MKPEKRVERYELAVHVSGPFMGQVRGISQTCHVGQLDLASGKFYYESTVVEPVDTDKAKALLGDAVGLAAQIDDQVRQVEAAQRDVDKYKRERDDERETRQRARNDLVVLQQAVQAEALSIAAERKTLADLVAKMQARIAFLEQELAKNAT